MDSNNKYCQLWKKIFTQSETERGHLIVHLAYVFIVTLCVSWAWGYAVKSTSPKPLQKLQILHPVPTKSFSSGIYFYIEKDPLWHSHACHFFNWTSPWKNMKHWLIICRMNHWTLESGSSELVKTHMVMVEIRLVVLTRSHKLREIS